ncbi:Crp/Fnr family transcriptional regulator [Rhizobium sp. C4]|uniref:Crp/Fnr family transcriptional regulator n=1 Tax=Rhizobium sp. C4 TaxID=1349800 RepID=UPI001E514D89|nr:Crp/Fnr family transcriptional regulator [Rhizobium sp. C4]MCD2175562.1 Crp/Fnr family transcriptional regulator [Rhizobium sp. C4]
MLHVNTRQALLPHPVLIHPGHVPIALDKPLLQFIAPGDDVDCTPASPRLYRVIDGCLAVYHLLADGRRQITDIVGPGRTIAQQPDRDIGGAIKALTFTEVEVLDPTANPDLATEASLDSLDRLVRHATLLGRMNAAEKVANGLLDLAAQFPRKLRQGRPVLTLYLTRGDLADWLGLTVETVSRTLNQFKRDGVIDYAHAEIVTLTKTERLKEIASGNNPATSARNNGKGKAQ